MKSWAWLGCHWLISLLHWTVKNTQTYLRGWIYTISPNGTTPRVPLAVLIKVNDIEPSGNEGIRERSGKENYWKFELDIHPPGLLGAQIKRLCDGGVHFCHDFPPFGAGRTPPSVNRCRRDIKGDLCNPLMPDHWINGRPAPRYEIVRFMAST